MARSAALHDQIIDDACNPSTDPGAVARDRLKVDTKKFLMAKMLPALYGDKVTAEVTGKDGGPIEVAAIDKLELGRWIALQLTMATQEKLPLLIRKLNSCPGFAPQL